MSGTRWNPHPYRSLRWLETLRRQRAMLTVGSLFSGIGGIDLGLERSGMKVAWQCEKDEAARRVLARHWPDVPCYDDVTTLKGADVPRVDVLCGGFPCQDLSVAGRRAGLAGERSGLFREFMRLASELAPRWVLVENVPGLLSSGHLDECGNHKCGGCDPGRDMGSLLWTLAELGYGWCYRVLDAQYLGVAQRRDRVFVVGCAGDARSAAQVLLEPEGLPWNPPPSRPTGQEVAGTLGGGSGRRGFCDDLDRSGAFIPIGFQSTNGVDICAAEHTTPPVKVGTGIGIASPPSVVYNPYRTLEKDGSITSGFAERPVVDALHGPTGNKEPLVVSDTLRSHPRPGSNSLGNVTIDGLAVRRLLPIECERLQGFPDDWTAGESDSARYRMLGNAVCVPVAEWIGRRMVAA